MKNEYRMCTRCIMDTTASEIRFVKNGYCNYCTEALEKLQNMPLEKEWSSLEKIVKNVKENGKGKEYDCIIGVSGGVDSSYTAYNVKKLGLRPLAVHLDNGWDSELAVKNIENICNILDIDLFTYVIDWEEFKDLQLSFLKASTPDSEIPTDHAIVAILYEMASKKGLKYILMGSNIASESIMPRSWSTGHADWKYISSIQKQFGTKELKSFPHYSLFKLIEYKRVEGIARISFLDYFDYNKQEAKKIIENEIGWRDYGEKHYESKYTKFFQAYILPTKFGFDKRKAHLSSLIVSGQITREQALEELKNEIYPPKELEEDIDYVANKFGITRDEFNSIMNLPPKTYWDYPNYQKTWYYKLVKKVYRSIKPRK
ncbi:N-acetyl sugar amidotransferase [Candidatus Bathyarchaeota archaeon]|nr:N-acetyl sugar amidotransferase [Candidatus Bathyarchaeota archaeon]